MSTNKVMPNAITDKVREHYAAAAKQVTKSSQCGCGCGSSNADAKATYYDASELRDIPVEAAIASLGCGNPLLLAKVQPGETVLDLGSGGGIDVLLSAKRVGPTGKAYGLDMTDEMLALARANAIKAGATNVEFLKGQIESIPLPDASVDVIISNCVINLSTDKSAVLSEAFRVLRPGGRLAVADIVVQGKPFPAKVREVLELWAGCIAGALQEEEYKRLLIAAGFQDVSFEVIQEYSLQDVPAHLRKEIEPEIQIGGDSRFVSDFVRAVKPS